MTRAASTPKSADAQLGVSGVLIGLSLISLVAIVVFYFVTRSPEISLRSGTAISAASSHATPQPASAKP